MNKKSELSVKTYKEKELKDIFLRSLQKKAINGEDFGRPNCLIVEGWLYEEIEAWSKEKEDEEAEAEVSIEKFQNGLNLFIDQTFKNKGDKFEKFDQALLKKLSEKSQRGFFGRNFDFNIFTGIMGFWGFVGVIGGAVLLILGTLFPPVFIIIGLVISAFILTLSFLPTLKNKIRLWRYRKLIKDFTEFSSADESKIKEQVKKTMEKKEEAGKYQGKSKLYKSVVEILDVLTKFCEKMEELKNKVSNGLNELAILNYVKKITGSGLYKIKMNENEREDEVEEIIKKIHTAFMNYNDAMEGLLILSSFEKKLEQIIGGKLDKEVACRPFQMLMRFEILFENMLVSYNKSDTKKQNIVNLIKEIKGRSWEMISMVNTLRVLKDDLTIDKISKNLDKLKFVYFNFSKLSPCGRFQRFLDIESKFSEKMEKLHEKIDEDNNLDKKNDFFEKIKLLKNNPFSEIKGEITEENLANKLEELYICLYQESYINRMDAIVFFSKNYKNFFKKQDCEELLWLLVLVDIEKNLFKKMKKDCQHYEGAIKKESYEAKKVESFTFEQKIEILTIHEMIANITMIFEKSIKIGEETDYNSFRGKFKVALNFTKKRQRMALVLQGFFIKHIDSVKEKKEEPKGYSLNL